MRARYYISFDNATWTEFFPTNSPKVSWPTIQNEIFKRYVVDKFRIGRRDNIDVYDTLYQRFFDPAYFGDDIYYKIEELGTDKFYFIDPIHSGKIDTQNNVYECTPDTDDEYRDILAVYEKKYQDRSDSGGAASIFGEAATLYYPFLNTKNFSNVDFSTFTGAGGSVYYTNTVLFATQKARCLLDVTTNNKDIVSVIITNRTVSGQNPTIKLVNSAFATISNVETITANGKYNLVQNAVAVGSVYVELSQTHIGGTSSGSFDFRIFYPKSTISGGLLIDVITAAFTDTNALNLPSYLGKIKSTYLWNDALPSDTPPNIDTYITANPTLDYVTENTAIWNDIWLARCDGFTTETEESIDVSLKDLMDALKIKLRAWWYIDADGDFRIEHEKYFRDYDSQADLTSTTYAGDKPEVDVRVYTYEKTDLFSQINYSEQNQFNPDWISYPALFSQKQTSKNVKDVSLVSFSSDIEYIIENPDDASSSGWVFLRMVPMDTNYLISLDPSPVGAGIYYLNTYLSWTFLQKFYFKYFAEAETGTVNTQAFTFDHVREFLKQNNIKFRMAADFDWRKPFTLIEGDGWVENCEYDVESGMYKIDVGFNPYSIEITVVDSEDTSIIITDDAGDDIIL